MNRKLDNGRIIVTGGAGFIGSNLVKYIVNNSNHKILNIDKLTYAGNQLSLIDLSENENYTFEKIDICDFHLVHKVIVNFRPNFIMHLAAESHVDRSIDNPVDFINTNILGTYNMLQSAFLYFKSLDKSEKENFRFLHVSTDEVYGSLGSEGLFTETTPYKPSSPYSASKASSDHLVRAWNSTFGLPTIITNCSNNYGPYQFPEKLIPVTIINALNGDTIPIYGQGENIRDWLFVEDHVTALLNVIENGRVGETYNIGGRNEKKNIEVVKTICEILDKQFSKGVSYKNQISYVKDRPGHDFRYAIDTSKIESELGFKPKYSFETGMEKTVLWYVNNQEWIKQVLNHKDRLLRQGLSF